MKFNDPPSIIVEESIDKTGSWAYFDGATQGDPLVRGVEGILFIFKSHFFKFKAIFGKCTNKKVELMVLKLILMIVVENGVQKLQTMGDSMNFINWLNGVYIMEIFLLRPIYEDIIN
jgi:ribonuclease HI